MCGIAGILYRDPRRRVEEVQLHEMVDTIRHRGPDDEGYFAEQGFGVGMCRLSIIDVAGGHQPMLDGQQKCVVVQNGEIYNYIELRAELIKQGRELCSRSDTEVLPYLYLRDGDGFAKQLNGMFAIALWDRERRRLILVRDRLGKKPLYVWDDGEKLIFASEIKAILASGLVAPSIDLVALHHYFSFNYVPPVRTIFSGIRHVEPAHVLTVENGAIASRPYWSLPLRQVDRSKPQLHRELLDLLVDSARMRLRADVPVAIFLSGGLDSSAVTWASRQAEGSGRPNTFSIRFANEGYDESSFARIAAGALGSVHHELLGSRDLLGHLDKVIWHTDQPHGDASFLPLFELSHMASRTLKVALTGDGADELFGGYSWHSNGDLIQAEGYRPVFERNAVFSCDEKRRLYREQLRELLDATDSSSIASDVLEEARALDSVNRLLYLDLKLLLVGNNLVKVDRMGMAHGLELRAPFLDYRLVEFAFSIPGPLKVSGGDGKHGLKEALASVLPPEVLSRPKQMFRVPMNEWFREAPAYLEERLVGADARLPALVRAERVTELIHEHTSGRDHTRKLRALLALETWMRVFDVAVSPLESRPT